MHFNYANRDGAVNTNPIYFLVNISLIWFGTYKRRITSVFSTSMIFFHKLV